MLWTENLNGLSPSCWEDHSFNAYRRLGENNLVDWANRFVHAEITRATVTTQDAAAIFGLRWVMEEYLTSSTREVRVWLPRFYEWAFWLEHTMKLALGIAL